MFKPLDYAELEKAADELVGHVWLCSGQDLAREWILKALTDIAKRATEQAAYNTWSGKRIGGNPPVPLVDALAALDAPDTETKEAK